MSLSIPKETCFGSTPSYQTQAENDCHTCPDQNECIVEYIIPTDQIKTKDCYGNGPNFKNGKKCSICCDQNGCYEESKKKSQLNELDTRPSWDNYFLEITRLVAKRSTCIRRKVGAVIVKDRRILTTGYNGAPSGVSHCLATGCLRQKLDIPSGEKHEMCRGVHAEQNAIIQAAYHGVSIKGSTLYCTTLPCSICAKMIINAGISRIIYESGYDDTLSKEFLTEANVELIKF